MFDFFKSKNSKFIDKHKITIKKIHQAQLLYKNITQKEMQKQFNQWVQDYTFYGKNLLDKILVSVFGMVKEVSERTTGLSHYDVQLLGGIALYYGHLIEMNTGEGKTLVATCPAVLRSIANAGVHIVTVNDYLANEGWMICKKIYDYIGISNGRVLESSNREEKVQAYQKQIVYCNKNQVIFDYLYHSLRTRNENSIFLKNIDPLSDSHQPFYYAIIDEVDLSLIDNGSMPCIVSGLVSEEDYYNKISEQKINLINNFVKHLKPTHYHFSSNLKRTYYTNQGLKDLEFKLQELELIKKYELYIPSNAKLIHLCSNLLHAHKVLKKDKDYILQEGKAILVDEYTGRLSYGRRFSGGLHQAIEIKENIEVQQDYRIQASISVKNFFKCYKIISGMSGTLSTDISEFEEIFDLSAIIIPPNKPLIRKDNPYYLIYKKEEDMYNDIILQIQKENKIGRPILVCCNSIYQAEYFSFLLNGFKVKHNLLTAKNHSEEALLISQAGKMYQITISTSMSGRGTDALLGGNPEMEIRAKKQKGKTLSKEEQKNIYAEYKQNSQIVNNIGGLSVIVVGVTRNKKTYRQFIGRAGRQGNQGSSIGYCSIEDPSISIIFKDGVNSYLMESYYLCQQDNKHYISNEISNKIIKSIHDFNQQSSFEIRKNNIQYDDVLTNYRNNIYYFREYILTHHTSANEIIKNIANKATIKIENIYSNMVSKNWNKDIFYNIKIFKDYKKYIKIDQEYIPIIDEILDKYTDVLLDNQYKALQSLLTEIKTAYYLKISQKNFNFTANQILTILDTEWYRFINYAEDLRNTIHIVGYENKSPEQEYKILTYDHFVNLLDNFNFKTIKAIIHEEKYDFTDSEDFIYKDKDIKGLLDQISTIQQSENKTKSQVPIDKTKNKTDDEINLI